MINQNSFDITFCNNSYQNLPLFPETDAFKNENVENFAVTTNPSQSILY
jgi:hypothetical protein